MHQSGLGAGRLVAKGSMARTQSYLAQRAFHECQSRPATRHSQDVDRDGHQRSPRNQVGSNSQKKSGVVEYPQVFDHAGLLVNEPPSLSRVALRLVVRRRLLSSYRSRLPVDMGSLSPFIVTR